VAVEPGLSGLLRTTPAVAQANPVPRKVTDAIKRRLVNGLPGFPQDYELDRLIPLGLGGHPRSLKNPSLQTWPDAVVKDRNALRLHREVCASRMTLEQAQHEMLATWGPR
jgi:hypothetical protein